MDADIGALLCAIAVVCLPLLMAWAILSWQDRAQVRRSRT